MQRPVVRGKFLFVGDEKLIIRGTTYGTFRPDEHGDEYFAQAVERDFTQMAAAGLNAVRVYTVPPRWLLDIALTHGLRVMVGLPWEQHITFLDDHSRMQAIGRRLRDSVRACAGHPAILCFAVGNEIPSSIVRWHGAPGIERFLRSLARIVKSEDPDALVTYVNFPSTEYLNLDFVDFVSFNVYLESRDKLERYLDRLQNLAGDLPLVMAEVGLDSARNGVDTQAETLDWQIRTVFGRGCAGIFVFAWTDEWYRGGYDIEDWDFGLVTRDRRPKPALDSVMRAFSQSPFSDHTSWPFISVIVCSYNGSRTIRDTLEGISCLAYPNFEVIVVDDGSTDSTAAIASQYDVRLIQTPNEGLSAARNTGLGAASGEIVAYIDDDARPDRDWLSYLVTTYMSSDFVAVGGPNLAPAGDGWIADAVANAPGGPMHVLLTDIVADHIPGCNLSARRERLEAIGGFDTRYRVAGDDVDVCWRLQEQGGTIGFSPAALVWHHRRNSITTYWKQQIGYGKAEALLEHKWPQRYNAMGHLSWTGRIYGRGLTQTILGRMGRIYQGTWGSALFQSMYHQEPGAVTSLPLMPEWWLLVGILGVLSATGLLWAPLLVLLPVFLIALLAPVVQAVHSVRQARFTTTSQTIPDKLRLRLLTATLHILQPIARLRGRLRHDLSPWRRRTGEGWRFPTPLRRSVWSEQWRAPDTWVAQVEQRLHGSGTYCARGGVFDRWDLEVRGGLLGSGRLVTAIEEHGGGKQLCRIRMTPIISLPGVTLLLLFTFTGVLAALDGALFATSVLWGFAVVLAIRTVVESGWAIDAIACAVQE
jgi:GT2 family glycosyltransferase